MTLTISENFSFYAWLLQENVDKIDSPNKFNETTS